jgi:hypothetical protein
MLFTPAASDVIRHRLDSPLSGTVGAAEKGPLRLHAVTHDFAPAVIAYRSQLVDGTLEAVEGVRMTGGDYLEGEIVVVTADFASSH